MMFGRQFLNRAGPTGAPAGPVNAPQPAFGGSGSSVMPNASGSFAGAPGTPRPATGPSPLQWGTFPAQSGQQTQPVNPQLMARLLMSGWR